MHPKTMTLPDLMCLSFRMAFLAVEMQLIFAARLWGFSKKVQEEAQALAEDLPSPMEVVMAPIAEALPEAAAPVAPAAARRARRRAPAAAPAPEARLN